MVTRERAEDNRRQLATYITESSLVLLATLERRLRDFYARIFEGTQISDLKTILKVHDQIRTQLP